MKHKFYILNKPIQYKEQAVYGVIASAFTDEICFLLAMDMVKQAVLECGWVLEAMDLAMAEVVGYLPTCFDFQDGYLINEECYHHAMENSLVLIWMDVVNDLVDIEDLNCEDYQVKNTNRNPIANYDEFCKLNEGKNTKVAAPTQHLIMGCKEYAEYNKKKKI